MRNRRGGIVAFLVLVLLFAAAGVVWYIRVAPEQPLAQRLRSALGPLGQRLTPIAATSGKRGAKTSSANKFSSASAPKTPAAPAHPEREVTLFLANGRVVTGELISETPAELILSFENSEVTFTRGEIARIQRAASQ